MLLERTKALNFLKLIGINALIFVILVEIAGIITYAMMEGTLFYLRDDSDRDKTKLTMKVLHPYFGYSQQLHREDKTFFANNYGFTMVKDSSPHGHDYPTKNKDENTVLVGVFGGSVAQGFAWSMQKTGFCNTF